jgi:hypothetical protein
MKPLWCEQRGLLASSAFSRVNDDFILSKRKCKYRKPASFQLFFLLYVPTFSKFYACEDG